MRTIPPKSAGGLGAPSARTMSAQGPYDVSNEAQGLWFGVVIPIVSKIFGVIVFLRLPWIVGRAGTGNAFGIIILSSICTFVTMLSLSAAATNGDLKGGGIHYILSRSLGPALGAGVGMCLWVANCFGAAMSLMGTVEAWETLVPSSQIFSAGDINNVRCIGLILLAGNVICVGMGINQQWISKFGTFFLGIAILMLVVMYLGIFIGPDAPGSQPSVYTVEWRRHPGADPLTLTWGGIGRSSKYYDDNWGEAPDVPQHAYSDNNAYGFLGMLGLWFPASTCLMAGSNGLVNLKDPARDIPTGGLISHVSTFVVYIVLCLLYGGVAPRDTLINDPFFASTAAWPAKEIVVIGLLVHCFWAAFAGLEFGTRLFNDIASEETLPIMRFLAAPPGREPRWALIASGLLCSCAIDIGELNAVAPIVTVFFLMCYACVNASCMLLDAVQDPNWHPTFRFSHWAVSLFGMCLCIVLMFGVNPIWAAIAIVFCFLVMGYATYAAAAVKWGDGLQGIKFQLARNILMKMDLTAHTKNWRPQLLVITEARVVKAPKSSQADTGEAQAKKLKVRNPDLLKFVSQFKGGRGITIVGGICDPSNSSTKNEGGSFLRATNFTSVDEGKEVMQKVLKDFSIEGFGQLLFMENFVAAVRILMQTSGLGAFQPNCVMMSWPEESAWKDRTQVGLTARSRMIRTVQTAVVLNKVMLLPKGFVWPSDDERLSGTIDIWWIVGDGGMLLLLPFLLKKHQVWQRCKTRLFVVADRAAADPEQLGMDLKGYVKDFRLDVEVFVQMLDSDGEVAAPAPKSSPDVRLDVTGNTINASALLRQHSPTTYSALTRQFSEGRTLGLGNKDENSASNAHDSLQRHTQGGADSNTQRFVSSAEQLASNRPCSPNELAVAAALGAIIAKESAGAELVITNLPDMPPDESAYGYFEVVDAMTKGLQRCLLVRGTAQDVITQFT